MNLPLTVFDKSLSRHPGRLSLAPLMLALCLALHCSGLLAEELDSVAKANSSSAPQAEVPWLSGGIGDEALLEMRKVAASYNVHIIFSNRQGSYLAGIPFRVARSDGTNIYSGISEGPLLFLRVSPGNYRISAEIDGEWQNRRIRAGAARSSVRLMFVARGG